MSIKKLNFEHFFSETINMCDNLFIDRIDSLLAERKMKRAELLRMCELAQNSFVNWKRFGTVPAADVMLKIADSLDTDVKFLLTGKRADSLSTEEVTLLDQWHRLDEGQKTTINILIQGFLKS